MTKTLYWFLHVHLKLWYPHLMFCEFTNILNEIINGPGDKQSIDLEERPWKSIGN